MVLNCLYSHLSQKDLAVLSKNILKSFFKHTSELIHLIINKTKPATLIEGIDA